MLVSDRFLLGRRAHGHAAACLALLGRAEGIDHHAAVRRHARFVFEVLLELGGHRHELHGDRTVLPAGATRDGKPTWTVRPGDEPIPGPGARVSATQQPPESMRCCGEQDVGTLFVSLHRGNWIVGARALGDPADPLHTVAGRQLGARLGPILTRWLGARGVVVHGPGGSWAALHGALTRGGRVLLHLDGDPFAPGLGRFRARPVPLGVHSAALLAARTRARVVWVTCERTDAGFEVRAEELAPPARGAATGAPSSWERVLLDRLRAVVGADPESWIVFRSDHLGERAR